MFYMYVACTMSTVRDCTHTTQAYNYTTTKSPFHEQSSPSQACYLRARKWRHHSVTFAHVDITFTRGDIAMSLSLGIRNVTFARDSRSFTNILQTFFASYCILFIVVRMQVALCVKEIFMLVSGNKAVGPMLLSRFLTWFMDIIRYK